MKKNELIKQLEDIWGYEVEKETVKKVKKNLQFAKNEYTEYEFWGTEIEVNNRTKNIVVIDKNDKIHVVASDEAVAYGWMEEYFNH